MATATAPLTRPQEATRTPRRTARLADSLRRGTRIGSWIVERELGRGGMATVYAVTHAKFGRRAAIKIAHSNVLTTKLSHDTFLREARIARSIEHGGVIDVWATGEFERRPYLVMERLAGVTLGQRIDAGPPMPRPDAMRILLELCDLLRATHAAGIVHRDLKLDNVMLLATPYEADRRVKLLDWGVAHVASEEDPFRGLIAGTLTYVAPEQIRGETLTGAADVYALAVLAYHLLCRRPPFSAESELALIQMHLRATPPRPSIAWPEIPDDLEELLLAMLEKQPADRPALDEVERVLRATLAAPTKRPAIPDPLCRPQLWSPPLRPGWIGLAIAATALAALVSALPLGW